MNPRGSGPKVLTTPSGTAAAYASLRGSMTSVLADVSDESEHWGG